ncbi:MAG: bifunctional precorrin-2 dehydrogenase/sirohydrochlorin ferrochelatase [Deltaproteobacteria bacterium]|nr:bifunctional precorrin-2 dehydrogenase/sirohydrochlorin ferrochelatase [Deltaproteobacteria bacterium]
MRYYPVFLDLQGTSCLVVGGGQVGERKVKSLLDCGAVVHLVSPELTPYLEEAVRQGKVVPAGSAFAPAQLEGMFLVIGATDDPEVNRQISAEARARNLLCNIVDRPRECNFIVPATVRRGDLTIAVSTGGRSPALAKKIREDLEKRFPDSYNKYLELLGRIREYVLSRGGPQEENQGIFESLVSSALLETLQRGDREGIRQIISQMITPPPSEEEIKPWLEAAIT